MRLQQLNTFWAASNTPASCASTIFKHTQKSRCIAETAFIISINPHSTVEIFSKISRGMSQSEDMHILNYGRRIRHRYA